MTKINDGGPAYPVEGNDMFGGRVTQSSAMSLRDAAALGKDAAPVHVAEAIMAGRIPHVKVEM